MCNSLSFAHEEMRNISTILQIVGELNETYECYILYLRNQRSDESIDEYVTELKNICDCLCNSLLHDKLVKRIVDKETRKKLLTMKKLTLLHPHTHHIVAPGFVDRPRRSDCTAGQMDGEAGWWTTSGNIGLPPTSKGHGSG